MRILYQPQLSMRSYGAAPQWLTSSDAHLTKLKAYVAALPADWEWHVLMPSGAQRDGPQLAVAGRVVHEHYTPHMQNVHQERFNFPMVELVQRYAEIAPELLLCEVPEQVAGWRAVQTTLALRCPIVTLIEHLDFYAETAAAAGDGSFLRQLEGALAADATVFPLAGMRTDWCAHARTLAPALAARLEGRCHLWPGLFSAREVDGERVSEVRGRGDGDPVLFLISRLSDPARTRYAEIIAASNLLLARGVQHTLWVANPNHGQSFEWIAQHARAYRQHPFGERTLARTEYLRLLWAADVVPIMYDLSRIYSVGACEAAAAGNVVLTAQQRYAGPRLPSSATEPEAIADALAPLLRAPAGNGGGREIMLKLHGVAENLTPALSTIEQVLA